MSSEIICLCGSTKLKPEILKIAEGFTIQGFIVLLPLAYSHYDNLKLSEIEIDRLKQLHLDKILLCGKVIIITKDNYLGDGLVEEIEFSKCNRKIIEYINL